MWIWVKCSKIQCIHLSIWRKLTSLGKREPQLKSSLCQTALRVYLWSVFLISGWGKRSCSPLGVALGDIRKQGRQATDGKTVPPFVYASLLALRFLSWVFFCLGISWWWKGTRRWMASTPSSPSRWLSVFAYSNRSQTRTHGYDILTQ